MKREIARVTAAVLGMLFCLIAARSLGQNYTVLHNFGTNESGIWPHGALVQGENGIFYGTAGSGGIYNKGQVFKISPDGSGYTPLKDFTGADGENPQASLLLSGNTLYGTTFGELSIPTNYGTVFRINIDGTGFAVLKHFNGSDGARSFAPMLLSGTTLYGTTSVGGGSNYGTIFTMETDGTGYTVLKHFISADGTTPDAGLCLVSGALYGTTREGGAYGGGTVFKINLDGTGYTVLKDFPFGSLFKSALLLSGTRLYGTTWGTESDSNFGTVFAINLDGSGYTVLKTFTGPDGRFPNADLVSTGDMLFGRTFLGGDSQRGVVFKLATDGTAFTVIKSLLPEEQSSTSIGYNWKSGLCLSGTTLYGTSFNGGRAGLGALFRMNTDGSDFAMLKAFSAGDGKESYSGLVTAGGILYGTTYVGGASNCGTLFKILPDGTGYNRLKEFAGSDGESPEAGMLVEGNVLYGTTCYGGSNWNGTLFKMNTDGTGYNVLRNFGAYEEGVFPTTVPILSGTTLYAGINYGKICRISIDGTAYSPFTIDSAGGYPGSVTLKGATLYGVQKGGGSHSGGMLYRINTDGSGFAILKEMGGAAGSWPNSPLVLVEGTLYGTAYYSGNNYAGTLFKVNTDGSGFAVLKHFTGGDDGGLPYAGLVPCGDTLYGTAAYGGASNNGTVFKIRTDGSDFAVLKSFDGTDGRFPYGNLVLLGTHLYGTTMYGGNLDKGVIFKVSAPTVLPVILSSPATQTAEVGGAAHFRVGAEGDSPLTCHWFFNGTNLLSSSTNLHLALFDVQSSQAGSFTAVVTNQFGAATSAPAMLSVIAPVERRTVPAAVFQGTPGTYLDLECTEMLGPSADWVVLNSMTMTGVSQICFDLSTPLPAQRYYRGRQSGSRVVTVLDLKMVPAITLAGEPGYQVRVDGINAIGPTDAWFAIDTVTLTNTSQLYFDISCISQPRRLYRLVLVP